MKKALVALALVSAVAGAQARQRKQMNNNNMAEKSFNVTIDNTESNKPSVITLNFDNSPRYMAKIVPAGKTVVMSKKGYAINNIGVRQGRGPASTKEKDAFKKPISGNYMVKIMSDNTPGGFSVRFGAGNGNGNSKGFFGWFK